MCITYRYLGYFLVSVLFLVFSYCIWGVCTYYSINPLHFRFGKMVCPIRLTYPPSPNDQPGIMASVMFSVESNKMITEGAILTLANVEGHLLTGDFLQGKLISDSNIKSIEIGFKEAMHPGFISTVAAINNELGLVQNRFVRSLQVFLRRKATPDTFSASGWITLETLYNNKFFFTMAGDYPPSMRVTFNDNSQVECTDCSQKLHVLSKSEVQARALNQINALITIILLIFGYLAALKLVYDVT